MELNPYEILGVAPDCEFAVLKAAYRARVRCNHPDLAPDDASRERASARMLKINAAWHLVRDPQIRAEFDANRLEQSEKQRPRRIEPPIPSPTQSAPQSSHKRTKKTKKFAPSTAQLVHVHLQNALRLFYEQKRPDKAAALCRTILRLDFRHVAARELLSEICMSRGEWNRARELLRQAVKLAPDNIALRHKLRVLDGKAPPRSPVASPANSLANSLANAPIRQERLSLWKRLRRRLAF